MQSNAGVRWRRLCFIVCHGSNGISVVQSAFAHGMLKSIPIVGINSNHAKRMDILNRWLEWKEDGIEMKADPKHAQGLIEAMGLNAKSKGSNVPGKRDEVVIESEELNSKDATRCRALAATANYAAQDRADVQFAAKDLFSTSVETV
jgi:hypothetical protein